jgi:hypothetical protein
MTTLKDWLNNIEEKLTMLFGKAIEFIFGEKYFNSGSPTSKARWRSHYLYTDIQIR